MTISLHCLGFALNPKFYDKYYLEKLACGDIAKYEKVASPGLLQPLPTPTSVFSDLYMDFMSGLHKLFGKETILVVVDKFTKYGHFISLAHPYTPTQVAQLVFDNIFVNVFTWV